MNQIRKTNSLILGFLLFVTMASNVWANGGEVTIFAGSGAYGSNDGTGKDATFRRPEGVAVDSLGNVYVADTGNTLIRKISPQGVVTTLAGDHNRVGGWSDGKGTMASFGYPIGIAVDSSGNVYVADRDNNSIRKITADGIVTTLAGGDGSRREGNKDGIGTVALFSSPMGVAVDLSGNVYVADTGNYSIRKITPDGIVRTIAGSGYQGFKDGKPDYSLVPSEAVLAPSFYSPTSIAVDSFGNIYVIDDGNIREITSKGLVTTLKFSKWVTKYNVFKCPDGRPVPGMKEEIKGFGNPSDISVDSIGNLYIVDAGNRLIFKITRDCVVTTFAGTVTYDLSVSGDGASTFNNPAGLVVDSLGNVYVADTYNNMIRKITPVKTK